MKTRTYAEILAGQGEYAQAASIYRHLIKHAPSDAALGSRLTELEHLAATAPPPERAPASDRHDFEPPSPAPPPRAMRPVTARPALGRAVAARPVSPEKAARREVLLALLDRITLRRRRS